MNRTKSDRDKVHIFVFGLLFALLFSISDAAMNVMYGNAAGTVTFESFFRGIVIIVAVAAALAPKRMREWLSPALMTGMLAMSLASIFLGYYFAYNTKTDTFLFYFLSALLTALLFVVTYAYALKTIFRKSASNPLVMAAITIGGAGVGYLIYFLAQSALMEEVFHLWYLVLALLIVDILMQKNQTRRATDAQ